MSSPRKYKPFFVHLPMTVGECAPPFSLCHATMTEATFIRRNLTKWREIELVCNEATTCAPDELARTYEELTTDLVFAQTHYPEARITAYLNDLALALHVQLYRRRPVVWSGVWGFVRREVPLSLYACRPYLLASLIVFIVGVAIGVISQLGDPEFARAILGDSYVEQTLKNIAAGQPMAVYSSDSPTDMFLGITLNNIWVSLVTFASGVLTFFGTGVVLMSNAVMLGSFQTFMFQHAVGWTSVPAIWLHGTLEISAIIVAGGAGLALGTGWLFPGTYSRGEAFRRTARLALHVVVGMVPLFVVAGFIEGFFTRHTEWPLALRLSVIGLSLAFVVFYLIIWPRRVASRSRSTAPSAVA